MATIQKGSKGAGIKRLAGLLYMATVFFPPLVVRAAEQAYIEEIIVTTRHRNEILLDVPGTINVLTTEHISDASMSSIHSLSEITINLQFDTTSPISGSSSSAAVFIRGIGQSEFLITNDPGVGLYVDGVYLSRTLGSVLDTNNIERIEIAKGPQGVLYGKNTVGGAINIITQKPANSVRTYVQTRLGDAHRRDAIVRLDLPIIENTLLSQFSLSSRNIEGYSKRILSGEKQGDEQRLGYMAKLRWLVSDGFVVDFNLDGQHIDEQGSSSALVANSPVDLDADIASSFLGPLYNANIGGYDSKFYTGDSLKSFATGPNYSKLDALGGSLHLSYDSGEHQIKSITAYRDMNASFGRDPDGTPITAIHTRDQIDHYQASQELRWLVNVNEKLTFLTGLYYLEEHARDYFIVDIFPELFAAVNMSFSLEGPYSTESTSYAGYIQGEWEFVPAWTLSLGGRYTKEEKFFQSFQKVRDTDTFLLPTDRFETSIEEFTPQASVSWQWSKNGTAYINYSEGFKSGGYVARYIVPVPQPVEFDPEFVNSYELGFKYQNPERRWSINMAAFYADYKDIQVLIFQGIVPLTKNAAKAHVAGAELEYSVSFGAHWQLNGGIGYIDAEYLDVDTTAQIEEQDSFANTPQWSTFMRIAFKQPIAGDAEINANLAYSWRSEVANDAPNTPLLIEGSLGLLNARLGVSFTDKKYLIALYGKNITDKNYIISGASDVSNFGITEVSVARGREIGIELTLQLDEK